MRVYPKVAACGVVPVAATVPFFFAGTYRHYRGTSTAVSKFPSKFPLKFPGKFIVDRTALHRIVSYRFVSYRIVSYRKASHDLTCPTCVRSRACPTCSTQGPASFLRKLGPLRVSSTGPHPHPRIWNSRAQSGVRSGSDSGSGGSSLVRIGLRYSLVYLRPWHSHEAEAFFRRRKQG